MTLKPADFDPLLRQVVSSPFLCRFLLLGFRHANGAAKSSQLHRFCHSPLEVLLPTNTRSFSLLRPVRSLTISRQPKKDLWCNSLATIMNLIGDELLHGFPLFHKLSTEWLSCIVQWDNKMVWHARSYRTGRGYRILAWFSSTSNTSALVGSHSCPL